MLPSAVAVPRPRCWELICYSSAVDHSAGTSRQLSRRNPFLQSLWLNCGSFATATRSLDECLSLEWHLAPAGTKHGFPSQGSYDPCLTEDMG